MTKNMFHSTYSRRDFMKFLGLAGGGYGAASVVSRVFHDMDEVLAEPESNWHRPWWVKKREFGDITQEMDWNVYQAFDYDAYGTEAALLDAKGADGVKALNQNRANLEAQHIRNKTPGYALRDRGLYDAMPSEGINSGFKGYRSVKAFFRYGELASPPVDIPRYQGTPEENIKMLRVVAKLRGAAVAGACEIDDKVRKMFYAKRGGKYSVFEDIDDGVEDKTRLVCPNKAKYILTLTVPMSEELIRRMPTALAEGAVMMGYSYGRILNAGLSNYLWCLGYLGLGAGDNSWKVHPAMAVWSGCGEASRMHQNYISPELGAMQRAFAIVTDLPLAPTEPVDFGIMKYCETCKKCAQICPPDALDRVNVEPMWDNPWKPFNQEGQKCWPFSFARCREWWQTVSTGCGMCMASCPFSHKKYGLVHDAVNTVVSTTPIFNGFMKRLDDLFGYGQYQGAIQMNRDPMDYINVPEDLGRFYNSWWDQTPVWNGIYNQANI